MKEPTLPKEIKMPAWLEPIAAIVAILTFAVVYNMIAYRFTK